VGASAWEHLELALEGGQSVSSVLLLLPSGAFHAAVCTQSQDGSGEDLAAAARGSWRPCRGGVRLEFPEEGGEDVADELEYELRNGHLVATTGQLPEGLVQEYASGQPDSSTVQLAAQHLLIDARSAFGVAEGQAAPGAMAAIADEGFREVAAVAEVEEAVRPPIIIADGDDSDSDDSLGDVLAAHGVVGTTGTAALGATGARGDGGGGPADEDYADDFEQPSDDEGEDDEN